LFEMVALDANIPVRTEANDTTRCRVMVSSPSSLESTLRLHEGAYLGTESSVHSPYEVRIGF
jgi:hypothetical protein